MHSETNLTPVGVTHPVLEPVLKGHVECVEDIGDPFLLLFVSLSTSAFSRKTSAIVDRRPVHQLLFVSHEQYPFHVDPEKFHPRRKCLFENTTPRKAIRSGVVDLKRTKERRKQLANTIERIERHSMMTMRRPCVQFSLYAVLFASIAEGWTSTHSMGRRIKPIALYAVSKDSYAKLNTLNGTSLAAAQLETEYYPFLDEKATTDLPSENIIENTSKDDDENMKNNINKARALILLAATLYGSNFPLVKMMGENTPLSVGMTSTLRFGLAAIATSPWLLNNINQIRKEWSTAPEAAAMVAGFEVGLWNCVAYIAQAVGLETTLASKSAFFCSMAVVVVPLLDFFFKGQKIQTNQIAGLVLAIVGVGALELGDMDLASGSLLSHGDLVSLIQPLAFGMAFWRMEAAMHKYPNQAMRATAAQLSAVFLGSAVFATFFEEGGLDVPLVQSILTDPVTLAPLLWTGLVTTALTIYMESVAMKTLSAAETTLLLSTEPVSGSLFAAALMGERLGPNAMFGSGLILVSCIISTLGFDKLQSFLKRDQASKP
jgi:drug/metabolite transporter (DMT)-like permease